MMSGKGVNTVMMFLLGAGLVVAMGCSTKGQFLLPEHTSLYVNDRPVSVRPGGLVVTRPFFWSASDGIPYRLEKGGTTVQQGTLPASFRVVSIFWPPYAFIYWPMGFRSDMTYDLVNVPQDQKLNHTMMAP